MKVSAVLIVKNEENCIEKCLQSLENFDEIVILDSIPEYSPVVIRLNGYIDICTLGELFEKFSTFIRITDKFEEIRDTPNLEIWNRYIKCRNGLSWSKVKYILRHNYIGKLVRLNTKHSIIDVTPNHSIFGKDGKVRRVEYRQVGDDILQGELKNCHKSGKGHINKLFCGDAELAWSLGFFCAEGSVIVDKKGHYRISVANQDIDKLERLSRAISKNLNIENWITKPDKRGGMKCICLGKAIYDFFADCVGKYGNKKVPKDILNAPDNIRKSFLNGYISGDGHIYSDGGHESWTTKSWVLAQGILWLYNSIGKHSYSFYIRNDKPSIVQCEVNEGKRNQKNVNVIKKKEIIEYSGYVYDLSTDNGKFQTGVGTIFAHNTGSTDKTGEICRKYTNKYFDNIYKWRDNFAEARNIAQALATTEWRFIIDSDEFLGEGSLEGIRNFIGTTSHRVIDIPCFDEINKAKHYQPRLYRNAPDIFWKARIHNYLSIVGETKIDDIVRVYYGYSKSHWDDPDRTLRILKKVVEENPNSIREWFYLAREYVYRSQWEEAIKNYKIYFTKAVWAPEIAEAYFQLSKCLWNSGKWSDAREAAMDAIGVNADFKEAITWLSYMAGPNNKERWLLFSETAEDNNTLFGSAQNELDSSYYDGFWLKGQDRSKFIKIWEQIGEWVGNDSVLDIGCGTGKLNQYIKGRYSGFDFSHIAIEKVEKLEDDVFWVGNIYDPENYKGEYDTYLAIDVIQRIKDKEFIQILHKGSEFIFTAPSWPDTGHMRFYTDRSVHRRLGNILDIKEMIRFNSAGIWDKNAADSNDCIYLYRSVVK